MGSEPPGGFGNSQEVTIDIGKNRYCNSKRAQPGKMGSRSRLPAVGAVVELRFRQPPARRR